jgi:CHAD domain-containing protein
MAVRTITEIERKYDVDAETAVPDLTTVAPVRVEETVVLRAVYFDTPQNDLASNLTILRRRSGGGDEGWHVKKPAASGRTEFHVPLDTTSSEQTPPAEIVDVVSDLLGDGPVQEIARLTTERAALTLLGPDGSALAEVTDDLVSATDVRTGILRVWREWEVEIAESGPTAEDEQNALLASIETVLLGAGARPSLSASKLARSLGRHSLAPTDTPSSSPTDGAGRTDSENDPESAPTAGSAAPTATTPGTADGAPATTALEAANTIISDLTSRLVAAEPDVRADEDDAVHAMRIVVRRLRGVLAAFRGVWSPGAVAALRGQLRQLGDVLGTARDAEVRRSRALALLGDAGDAPDAHRRLVDDALGEYEVLQTDLVRFFDGPDFSALIAALEALTVAPASADAADAADTANAAPRPVLRRALRAQQRRALRRLKKSRRSDLDSLHAARKAARRLRYVAEALTEGDHPVLGARARKVGAAAERVQDVLGAHRDAELFVERLAATSTQAAEAGESVAIYTELSTAERARALEFSEAIGSARKKLSRAIRK